MVEINRVYEPSRDQRITGRLVVGLVIVVLGILFLLDNFGYADAGDVLAYWPVVFIIVGLTQVMGSRRKVLSGTIFMIVGAWLLLNILGYVEQSPWDMWPVFLIIAGVTLVSKALRRPAVPVPGAVPTETGPHDAQANGFAFMSASSRKIVGEFLGGDLTAVMGGHDIDLRNARITNQGTAVIDVFVWWGGIDIKIPPDWKVSPEGLAIMGAFEDNSAAPQGEVRGHLVLKGLVVMGGVEVKN